MEEQSSRALQAENARHQGGSADWPVGDDSVLKVLLQEYGHLKDELAIQLQSHYRQTQFLQIYAALVIGALAILLRLTTPVGSDVAQVGDASQAPVQWRVPSALLAVFFGWTAAVAFFLASATLVPSYMFLVLRGRLQELERRINEVVKLPRLMRYELEIAPHFLDRRTYAGGLPTPHSLFGVWRALVFIFALVGLCVGSFLFTPAWFVGPYVAIVVTLACWHVLLALSLSFGAGRQSIGDFFQSVAANKRSPGLARSLADVTVVATALTMTLWIAMHAEPWNLVDLATRPTWYLFLIVTAYSAISTAVPFLFAEAGLVLYPQYGLAFVLISAALGRGIAVSVLHFTGKSAGRLLQVLQRAPNSGSSSCASDWCQHRGWWAYLLLQCIPFMPMRTSAVAYSLGGASWLRLVGGAVIGTVSRHLILLSLGFLSVVVIRAFVE